jgi:flap endonuclease-1
MGIPQLNRYLTKHCSEQSISKKHLQSFSGKTIAIDTSIYLYKFSGHNTLMENMFSLVSLLKHYKITPIFVFDGRPPNEKMELLKRRNADKQVAEKKYNELQQQLDKSDEKDDLIAEMDVLKKQFIRIKKEDIDNVKALFNSCGIMHCDALGEADQLCAKMVINRQAWACLSDDMDMFVYGCTRVLRHISLINHTVIFYNTPSILRDLKIQMNHFREIMVLSGTDYNNKHKTDLNKVMERYNDFRTFGDDAPSFYQWFQANVDNPMDADAFERIYNMFYISDTSPVQPKQSPCSVDALRTVMKPYGFVFVE